jgi:hypothetical protein
MPVEMATAEIRFSQPGEIASEIRQMRTWLDHQRYEPSRFTYDLKDGTAIIRLQFKLREEAELFARAFHGRVVDRSAPVSPSRVNRRDPTASKHGGSVERGNTPAS